VRVLKDAITRDILKGLEEKNIGLASSTYEIVGLPKLQIDTLSPDQLSESGTHPIS
jgi:hypothetical protein